MQPDPKDIFLTILTIIEYPDDKEAFVHDFLTVCQQQALLDLTSNLPPDKRNVFIQRYHLNLSG
jgi:DNA-directed RNA polymerase specialized sigma24 family protein